MLKLFPSTKNRECFILIMFLLLLHSLSLGALPLSEPGNTEVRVI